MAILAADVAGSSRLMADDEPATVAALAMAGERPRAAEALTRMTALFPGLACNALANLSCFAPAVREPATAAFIEIEAALGA